MNATPSEQPLVPDASTGLLFDPGSLAPASIDPPAGGTPRLRRAQRDQVVMRCLPLDALLPEDHRARIVWDYVQGLDLTALYAPILAVEGGKGRAATDPKILLALWLFATIEGIGSARALDRLCEEHLAYQWLAGEVSLN